VVFIDLQWVAGGSYIDVRHTHASSFTIASIYRCPDLFIDALVLNCEGLKIIFPEEKEDFFDWPLTFSVKAPKA
jgi:hypothetical protein